MLGKVAAEEERPQANCAEPMFSGGLTIRVSLLVIKLMCSGSYSSAKGYALDIDVFNKQSKARVIYPI